MVAAFALIGSAFLLIAAAVMLILSSGSRRAFRAIAGLPTRLPGEAGPGLVALTGFTDYGPGGPQTAPVSGEDSTWYRVEAVRSPSRKSDDRTGQDVLGSVLSPGDAALRGDTGLVIVDPRMLVGVLRSSHPRVTEQTMRLAGTTVPGYLTGLVGELRAGEELQLTETRLPRGRGVFAVGTLHPGSPVLTAARGDATVFTTDRRDQVLDRLERQGSSTRTLMRAFGVLGLLSAAVSLGAYYLSAV